MRWLSQNDVGPPIWSREFQVDLKPLVRFVRERPEMAIVGLGIALRVAVYLINRTMWLDELSLKANIADKAILDFSEQMTNDQLAPFGFLIVQRTLVKVLGDSNFVLRLLPLSAGILALVLFAHLARELLPRRAALVALVLFAFSDDLIYYASEMKPYSLDLAFGLAITIVTLDALGKPADRRSALGLITLSALAPWWSFASAFVIAGCGIVLLLDALIAGRYRTLFLWAIIGLGWLAVFAASFEASRALLTPYTTMYLFWDFAFLPNHPVVGFPWRQGLEIIGVDIRKSSGILLDLFVNQVGEITLARRSWSRYLLLALPIGMAMVASGYHLYPFHGRLMLELVPAFFLLIAAGMEWLGSWDRTRFRLFYTGLLIVLLSYPCVMACYQPFGRRDRPFNRHGDLHANVFVE
jgi:hypothetical protein